MLLYSEHVDPSQNKDINNYFRQATVNLKEILKIPGVWDPFIVSYVEVGHCPFVVFSAKELFKL